MFAYHVYFHINTKQIQTPRYIVQNSMNLKQYRHRPSHDSSQCFNLFPASAEKIRKTYRLRKRVFGKNFHAKTMYNSFKQSYPVQKVSFQISSLLKNLLQKIQTTSKLSTIKIAYFHNISDLILASLLLRQPAFSPYQT